MPDEKGTIPPPYVLAMVICDMIWRDPANSKLTILGCFSVIHCGEFPATHPIMVVHAEMTEGRGRVPLRLRVIDSTEESNQIFEGSMEIDVPDPRSVIEADFVISNLTFPSPGEYRFQLFAGPAFLMERGVTVFQSQEGSQ